MNAVDGTSREEQSDSGIPPSLLTIILDTNPHAWSLLSSTLPLTQAIANILVFINAHLAINNANRAAVIASHTGRAQFLYPTPSLPTKKTRAHAQQANGDGFHEEDVDMSDAPSALKGDANKYRPFATVENAITSNLRSLLASTSPDDLSSSTSTMLSGALTLALSYISKQTLTAPNSTAVSSSNDASNTAGQFNVSSADGTPGSNTTGLLSRILIISVSGDLATQYIPIMNSIFACQRLGVPIDILTLNQYSEAEFLQQAADATGGIYIDLGGATTKTATSHDVTDAPNGQKKKPRNKVAGLLQTLMMAYLPDQSARKWLVQPGESEGVDFRAACFCHGRVIDLGWVCSICLSIFCAPLEDNTCLTCGTYLSLSNYGTKPVVVPRKKAKKKRLGGIGSGTPLSRAETPGSDAAASPAPR